MATALGDFWGWTETQLLAGLLAAQQDLSKGKMLTSVGSGDVNSQMMVQRTSIERIRQFKRALYELYLQDSATYAAYADFYAEGQNTTVANFSGS